MYQKRLFRRNLSLLGECLSILYISKKVVRKELITSGRVLKHPISKKVVRKELITSGGVLKHPIYIKKRLFGRNLLLLGECLSILYQKRLFGMNLSLLGECLSILYQKVVVRTGFIISGKCIIIIFGNMLFGFITSKEESDCLYLRRS
jgi:hypothetical protein